MPNANVKPAKLRRLPKHARIQKRPLMHPPIPSPYAGRDLQKVIYISSNTPFISAVKRVRKLLVAIDKRDMGEVDLLSKSKDKAKIAQTGKKRKGEPEPVILKATAKAIEKALNLALFFQGQVDCRVHIKTGTLGVVDDIIEGEKQPGLDIQGEVGVPVEDLLISSQGGAASRKRKRSDSHGEDAEGIENGKPKDPHGLNDQPVLMEVDEVDEEEELPETQIRKTSVVEVYISLR